MSSYKSSFRRLGVRAAVAVVAVLGMLFAWTHLADAQPGQPAKPAKRAKPLAEGDKPARPVPPPRAGRGKHAGQPSSGRRPPRAKPRTRKQAEQMVRDHLARKQAEQDGKGAPTDAAPKKKYPVDAHGYCLAQGAKNGPNDRPKDINLFHGWLGVNNEKAIPAPRREGGWDAQWWKWRLTPYLWRYENHDDHCDPRNQPIPLLANIINLGALIFLLVRFGRKPVSEALKKRKDTIMEEVDRAREIKGAAKKRLDHYEGELDHLDDKLVALRDQYTAEGVSEEKRVVGEMKNTRERMMNDAQFRISQEGKASRDSLSREALDEALRAAEELLTTSVTKADHDRLAAEYLEQLGPALKSAERAKGGKS